MLLLQLSLPFCTSAAEKIGELARSFSLPLFAPVVNFPLSTLSEFCVKERRWSDDDGGDAALTKREWGDAIKICGGDVN